MACPCLRDFGLLAAHSGGRRELLQGRKWRTLKCCAGVVLCHLTKGLKLLLSNRLRECGQQHLTALTGSFEQALV